MAHDPKYDNHPDVNWSVVEFTTSYCRYPGKYVMATYRWDEKIFSCDLCHDPVDVLVMCREHGELCLECMKRPN